MDFCQHTCHLKRKTHYISIYNIYIYAWSKLWLHGQKHLNIPQIQPSKSSHPNLRFRVISRMMPQCRSAVGWWHSLRGITCGVAKHSFDPCSNILVEANIARPQGFEAPPCDWFQHESELYKFHLTILIILASCHGHLCFFGIRR